MNSKDYIREILQPKIENLINQQKCEHSWYKYGYGYECSICHYYTGQNKEINDIIKIELDRVKKLERIVDEEI